jgi:ElaB/YqjD/DUF883 family membrane-anchored ribosome-binding protein
MNTPSSSDYNDDLAEPMDPIQTAKASALKAAEELRHTAANKAQELKNAAGQRASNLKQLAGNKVGEIKDYADQALSGAKDKYGDLKDESEKYIREKPLQSVGLAFGVGIFLGLLLRR